ncbi:helix-turn-helix domain-containing protein [Calycomorphotria hydatis]|uniref:Anaerobic benzoate catabolism transcriptional regulator n=1 Tax=Calycomorphotria hydatis TaxID=2528027 RepID=A0A517TE23_9PLAN|nr:helix-turn-helix transcriptional regulator [Calycomorphotria hydatis]QDT66621.1 anaerobic benzoate catabolism transcriptional regulator [Calycomorphotria hydatis]
MFGQVLRDARIAAGMTQEDLAHHAQVDRTYISQLERDLKSPTLAMLFRLCDAMGISAANMVAEVEKTR